MKKRMLSIVMALAMILSLLPVTTLAAETPVSNGEDLLSAIESAESGDTIILGADVEVSLPSFVAKKTLVIDLGGNTLTMTNTAGISIDNGADITFKNGTLVSNDVSGNVNTAVIGVTTGSTVTLDKVTFNTDVTGLLVRGDAAAMNVVNGSVINATGYCFGTNASTENNHNVVITLADSTFNGSDAGAGTAMYINVPGTLNIDNCQINGYFQGLIVRGGTAKIQNSTIVNNVSDDSFANYFDDKSWGSGNTVNLAALTMGNKILSGNNAYNYPTDVTLVNTTITSAGKNANVYPAVYVWANADEGKGVTVSYDNCTINGQVVYGNNGENINDTVQNGVAKIGDTYYLTLADAVTAVPAGGTIVLQKDTAGSGIGTFKGATEESGKNPVKSFTIDFNTYTYTCSGPAVGSNGTQSQAFHLEWAGADQENAKVTLKNGTITSTTGSGVKMLVQNYCDLTLENITLDGSNLGSGGYTLSNNCGTVLVKGSTIIAPNSGVAFDACDYAGYTGVTVTVEGESMIQGAVEVVNDNGGVNNANLIVKGGTFTTDKVGTDYKGATAELLTYLADGYTLQYNDDNTYTVVEESANAAEVVADAPSVDLPEGLGEEDTAAAEEVKTALESSADLVTGTGLNAAAGTVANDNAITTEEGKKDLEAADVTVADDDEVTIVIQPYMDVKIVDLSTADKTLTLDINPMYKTVATTDKDNIKLGDNAVEIGTPKPLTITKPVTVTVPLPAGFLTDGTGNVYVKHTKDGKLVGYHTAAVNTGVLTFTNDKGFSTFEIKVDSRTAAVDFGGETGQITYTPANVGDTLPSATSAGQVFDGWTFAGIEGTYKTLTDELLDQLSTAYAGSGTAIVATAAFHTPSGGGGGGGVSSYAITVEESENGAVTADKKSAAEDAEITLTVKPNEGYVLESLTVTDKDGKEIALTDKGEGVYTFAMPASKVTVKATFAEAPVSSELPFTDVDVDDWFYGAVEYVYNNKLMDGTSSTTFSPLMTTTRSMIVTILWRLEGQPQVNYAMTFEDVAGDTWYTEAVRWAASEGIVKGYSDTVFAPDDIVSREQLATILDRYAQYKEYDVTAKGDLTTFVDGDTVSSWAADGMTWAVGAELITGKDGGKLDPTGTATRAEVATMLMRFCENVAK